MAIYRLAFRSEPGTQIRIFLHKDTRREGRGGGFLRRERVRTTAREVEMTWQKAE